jgi:hypothetical protein
MFLLIEKIRKCDYECSSIIFLMKRVKQSCSWAVCFNSYAGFSHLKMAARWFFCLHIQMDRLLCVIWKKTRSYYIAGTLPSPTDLQRHHDIEDLACPFKVVCRFKLSQT